MINPVLEFIASKITGEVLDHVIDSFRQRLDAENSLLLDRLAALDAKVDAQLLAPLRAGLRFLQLGKIENALEEFVRAEANDPYAACSKLCLGLTLLEMGHTDGCRVILESLELNPYLMEGLIPPESLPSVSPLLKTSPGQQVWQISFSEQSILDSLPPKPILQSLSSHFASRASAAVRSISTMALQPVVTWALGGDLRDPPEEFVSMFDLEHGTCVWTKPLSGSSIYLVTPRFVVLGSDDTPPLFKLLSVEDGRIVRPMRAEYFRLAFLGRSENPARGQLFAPFTRVMMPLEAAYEQTTVEIVGRGFSRLMSKVREFPFEHATRTFTEIEAVPIPSSQNTAWLTVTNTWSHAHVSYGQFAACGLWASASIACGITAYEGSDLIGTSANKASRSSGVRD